MNVLYSKLFLRQYRKFSAVLQDKIEKRIELFLEEPLNPLLHNHSLKGVYAHHFSINITGDYRAIYKKEEDLVTFVAIGTHSELYS